MQTYTKYSVLEQVVLLICFKHMIRFYACEDNGFVEKTEWQPHYWINVEMPDTDECELITRVRDKEHHKKVESAA